MARNASPAVTCTPAVIAALHEFQPCLQVQARPPMAVTNAVSWRSEGIRYKKNEVFLDVVESVNLLVNSNGTVVRSEVVGALKMRTFLSGMPECKLGLNDKVLPAISRGKVRGNNPRRSQPPALQDTT